jgi:hypothetical protein
MGGMRFRKLRIAWSVFWGLAYILLTIMWVRSYSQISFLLRVSPAGVSTRIGNGFGRVGFLYGKVAHDEQPKGWQIFSVPTAKTTQVAIEGPIANESSFKFDLSGGPLVIRVPHYVLVGGCGVLLALPWLPRRFTLRTLLIATTVVAITLAIIMWAAR